MKRLILHIGMHKTGSSSIQRSLQGYRHQGFKYLDLGSPNHSNAISAAFRQGDAPRGDFKKLAASPGEIRKLRAVTLARIKSGCSDPGIHTVIVSGETITGLDKGSLEALRAAFLEHVEEIKVFAYLREPIGYASSYFQQRIKSGYDGFRLAPPNYRRKFEKFITLFGREHVLAREFDTETLAGGSVVRDFCEFWKIPFEPVREIRRNESLSIEAVRLIHRFNRSGTDWSTDRSLFQARQKLVASIAECFPGRFDLPAGLCREAVDVADLQWVERQFGISFRSYSEKLCATPPCTLEQFMTTEGGDVLETYRSFLHKLKVPSAPRDTLDDLLGRHFERCGRDWRILLSRSLRKASALFGFSRSD